LDRRVLPLLVRECRLHSRLQESRLDCTFSAVVLKRLLFSQTKYKRYLRLRLAELV
jgi:hypothetical protein